MVMEWQKIFIIFSLLVDIRVNSVAQNWNLVTPLTILFYNQAVTHELYKEGTQQILCQDGPLDNRINHTEDKYRSREFNATMLRILLDDNHNGDSETELVDMLLSHDENPRHIDLPTFPEDTEVKRADVNEEPDAQAALIQVSDEIVSRDSEKRREEKPAPEALGTAAAIMIVTTCSVVCIVYTSLIVWRRLYLKRNGLKHELLRNEEKLAETSIEL